MLGPVSVKEDGGSDTAGGHMGPRAAFRPPPNPALTPFGCYSEMVPPDQQSAGLKCGPTGLLHREN